MLDILFILMCVLQYISIFLPSFIYASSVTIACLLVFCNIISVAAAAAATAWWWRGARDSGNIKIADLHKKLSSWYDSHFYMFCGAICWRMLLLVTAHTHSL